MIELRYTRCKWPGSSNCHADRHFREPEPESGLRGCAKGGTGQELGDAEEVGWLFKNTYARY